MRELFILNFKYRNTIEWSCFVLRLLCLFIYLFLFHTKDMEVVALLISNYDDGIYGRLRIEHFFSLACSFNSLYSFMLSLQYQNQSGRLINGD